ncbi:MAG TPA: 30S ribosome-binding factor RbfA [Polyangiaceae bacterium]|jgi:ribosome-binding factor A|nr:30S ribosome-binding factor RbfA [Polyangiaceae bacterium]
MPADAGGKGGKADAKGDKGLRARRVEGGVREELSTLMAQDLKDPRAAGAVVTRVEMAPDLRSARVHVRLLAGGDDEARRREVVGALGRASGMLRRELTHRLGLRYAPDLRFFYDEGMDAASNVERLLAEIAAEKKPR